MCHTEKCNVLHCPLILSLVGQFSDPYTVSTHSRTGNKDLLAQEAARAANTQGINGTLIKAASHKSQTLSTCFWLQSLVTLLCTQAHLSGNDSVMILTQHQQAARTEMQAAHILIHGHNTWTTLCRSLPAMERWNINWS